MVHLRRNLKMIAITEANLNETLVLMSRPPSRSPSYQNGLVPASHQIYPTPPPMPYYEPHQYGVFVPVANPYEGGTENSGWYPQQFNSNYQPYYQPDFGAPLPPLDHHIDCNYSPSYYDQSTRDTSPPGESSRCLFFPLPLILL